MRMLWTLLLLAGLVAGGLTTKSTGEEEPDSCPEGALCARVRVPVGPP